MLPASDASLLPALTGTAGLDDILNGGLTPDRMYLVEGTPGTGKTTLGLGFLLAGAAVGEIGLYITLAETEVELRAVATVSPMGSSRWSRRCPASVRSDAASTS